MGPTKLWVADAGLPFVNEVLVVERPGTVQSLKSISRGNVMLFCGGRNHAKTCGLLVELRGFEPLTSAVRLQRSPN